MSTRITRRFALLAGGVLIAACGWGTGCAQTGTQAVSRGGGVADSRRLLVVSQVGWANPAWAKSFETALLDELRRKRMVAAIQTRDPLALQADKIRYLNQITEFHPDMVLVLQPGDGTVDPQGRPVTRRFEAALYTPFLPRESRVLTWRASLLVSAGGSFIAPGDMPALARELVARLTADGILPKPPRVDTVF